MKERAVLRRTDTLTQPNYYPVLYALRFVLAFWVAVDHYETIPLLGGPIPSGGLLYVLQRGWNTITFGTPAVIVFFVISGFCIHLPFRDNARIDVQRYYLRRYTRILIPAAAALLIYRLFGQHLILWGEHSILWESPLWSLACEEIYYALYPALRWIRNFIGWKVMLPVSFVIAVAIAATHPHAGNWHVFGPFGTAVLLLPVWLMGCLLAEQAEGLSVERPFFSIWFWRFLAWLGCWLTEMLHFKMGVSYTQTMVWFGILAYLWVRQEIAHGKNHPPNRFLVAAGGWSYSLYLLHVQGGELFSRLQLPSLGRVPDWFLVMSSSLLFAYVFYVLVERPSHKLARRIRVRRAEISVASADKSLRTSTETSALPKEAVEV